MKKSENAAKSRATMKDVAVAAGVSQSTVSFVLNGQETMRISAETRQRVMDAVEVLGYRPRAAGRPPKSTGHRVIGLLLDEVATSPFPLSLSKERRKKHGKAMSCWKLS